MMTPEEEQAVRDDERRYLVALLNELRDREAFEQLQPVNGWVN